MGYSMHSYSSSFFLPKEYAGLALKAIHTLNGKWEESKKSDTLREAFLEWGWDAEESEDGDINYLFFSGDKYYNDDLLFEAIAPYVKGGSYLAVMGEDDFIWRWYFDGQKCIEQSAEIVWK